MSNQTQARRALFARTPRGNASNAKNVIKPTRIDASFLKRMESASLNPDMSTVLTSVGGDLRITIGPQSGLTTQIVKEGKVLADAEDILKIGTLNSSITKERREALKEVTAYDARYTLAAFVQEAQRLGDPITTFPRNFLEVWKPFNTQMNTLATNIGAIELLEAGEHEGKIQAKTMTLEFGKRIRIAVGRYVHYRARLAEGEVPRKLNAFLREAFVPVYMFNKLTSSVIQAKQQGFDLRSIYFPNDPTKGFYLTFREITEGQMILHMGGLLSNSDYLLTLFENDLAPIKKLINVAEATDLTNFEEKDSLASKIAGTPFYVPPNHIMVDKDTVMNYLAKNGLRGAAWTSGSTLTPQDNLKFVGTLAKRIHYGLFNRPMSNQALFESLFNGFTYDPADDEINIFIQLKKWASETEVALTWFNHGVGGRWNDAKKTLILRCYANVLGEAVNSDVVNLIRDALAVQVGNYMFPTPGGTLTGEDTFTSLKNVTANLKGSRADAIAIVGNRYGGTGTLTRAQKPVKKDKASAGVNERSILSDAAVVLLRDIPVGHTALAKRLDPWLRRFLSTEVQSVVANLLQARLSSFLANPLEASRAERFAFLETGLAVEDSDDDSSDDAGDNATAEQGEENVDAV